MDLSRKGAQESVTSYGAQLQMDRVRPRVTKNIDMQMKKKRFGFKLGFVANLLEKNEP